MLGVSFDPCWWIDCSQTTAPPHLPPRHQPSPFTHGQIQNYIYLYIIGAPKRRDQQLHKNSRRHRSLNECLDRLSGPDGPSRPSVPLSVCQDCLVDSPLLPRCCRLRCLGPFPWPVVTRHERSPPALFNECTSEEQLLRGFSSTPLTAHLQMWACLFI